MQESRHTTVLGSQGARSGVKMAVWVVERLTYSSSRVPPEFVVWIYDAFGNNFGIKDDFRKYLKKNCW